MNKPTPGPWHAEHDGEHANVYAFIGHDQARSKIVATIPQHIKSDDESVPNARLIAAAPDLLADANEIDRLSLVIESAVRNADQKHYGEVVAALQANRVALAKATTP